MNNRGYQGRALERAVGKQAKLYQRQGRCWLYKVPTPTYTDGNGGVRYGQKAPVDFLGLVAGGRAIAIETKETQADSLPLTDWPEHQREILQTYASMNATAWLVIDFVKHGETFVIDVKAVAEFLASPWRQSISLAHARAVGLLVANDGEHCHFLDGVPHPLQAESCDVVEAERAKALNRVIATIDELFLPAIKAEEPRRTLEEIKASVRESAAIGTERAGKRPARKWGRRQ